MHMRGKRDWSSDVMDTLRVPRIHKKHHKYTFTILISSWQGKFSMTFLPSCHWERSAMNTEPRTSGSAANSHGWSNKNDLFMQTGKFRTLIVLGLSSSSSSSPSQESSTSSSPASERSDELAPRKLVVEFRKGLSEFEWPYAKSSRKIGRL